GLLLVDDPGLIDPLRWREGDRGLRYTMPPAPTPCQRPARDREIGRVFFRVAVGIFCVLSGVSYVLEREGGVVSAVRSRLMQTAVRAGGQSHAGASSAQAARCLVVWVGAFVRRFGFWSLVEAKHLFEMAGGSAPADSGLECIQLFSDLAREFADVGEQ